MPKLAKFLQIDFFKGYQELLAQIATEHQNEFNQWLMVYSKQQPTENNSSKQGAKAQENKLNKMNRYWYRTYLIPKHLPINERHNHVLNVN